MTSGRALDELPGVATRVSASATSWQEAVFDVLKQGEVKQIAYVPDAGHSYLIRQAQADPEIIDVVLTTEEEGVALTSGAWLGGQRAVLLMQSSGVGNCVNMFSLLKTCQFPFFTLVTMRGEFGEFNPWQIPMGSAVQASMELMGIKVFRVDHVAEVAEVVEAAFNHAFLANERVAVLLGQRLLGAKKWVKN